MSLGWWRLLPVGPLWPQAQITVRLLRAPTLPLVVRPLRVRIAGLAPLDGHLPPDIMRGEKLAYHSAVARSLIRRNLEWHSNKSIARAGSNCKCTRALGQGTKPAALTVEHLDPPHVPIRVRI